MPLEPCHCLIKGLIFGKQLFSVAHIPLNGEAVVYPGEQVDLPVVVGLEQDSFALMAFLHSEDIIMFGGSNRQWANNISEFLILHEGGMGDEPAANAILVMADDILYCTLSVHHP